MSYVVRSRYGNFRLVLARRDGARPSRDDELTRRLWQAFDQRLAWRDPEALAAALALREELHPQASRFGKYSLETLRQQIESALWFGHIRFTEIVPSAAPREQPSGLAVKAPRAAAPSAPVEPTWFELTLVDEVGSPISGVEVAAGSLGSQRTTGAGLVRFEGVSGSFVAARISSEGALKKELERRWAEPGRLRRIPPDAKEVSARFPLQTIQLESEAPLVVAFVPPRIIVRYARHHAPETKRGRVLPIWGQLDASRAEDTPLPAILGALRHVAETDARHRLLVAGRGDVTDSDMLRSVALLVKGDREAWVGDAVSRHDAADYHRALLWCAQTQNFGSFADPANQDWTKASGEALRTFRVASNHKYETSFVEDATPRPNEDFGALFDAFERYFCEALSVSPEQLALARDRLELHDAPQLLGGQDPMEPGGSARSGLDLVLVHQEDAAAFPPGDVTAQLGDAERVSFEEVTAPVPAPVCMTTYVLDVEDVHFNHDRFILMPRGELKDEQGLKADRGSTGLHVLAAALRHAEQHPRREMLVLGHTDSTGKKDYNLELSEERAESVFYVLSGADFRQEFAKQSSRDPEERFDDNRGVLKWANERFGYDCDPGPTSGPVTAQYYKAVRHFQNRYNADVELLARKIDGAQGNAYAPLFANKIPSHELGWVGENTWGAFFDCYQRELMRLTQKDTYQSLQAAQRAIRQVGAGDEDARAVYGCGENHPRDPARRQTKRDAGYPDEQGERTPIDRRVEILFFDPGEAPPFPCHPSLEATSCTPQSCFLYRNELYAHRRLPTDGLDHQVNIELIRTEVRRDGKYQEGVKFCPPLEEDMRFTLRLSRLRAPFEGTLTAVIVRNTVREPYGSQAVEETVVARVEQELCVFEGSELDIEMLWLGVATESVPREFSVDTTLDRNDGKQVHIPLHEMEPDEIVRRGRYTVKEFVLVEKDGFEIGRLRVDKKVLVEMLCEAR
ncbi:MAG: OmpA family protein, partial [Polyangiaceae bacterium]